MGVLVAVEKRMFSGGPVFPGYLRRGTPRKMIISILKQPLGRHFDHFCITVPRYQKTAQIP